MHSLFKLAAIIGNERLVNNLAEYGYIPHQAHSRPFTHAIRPITLASNTSATRMMLSISSRHSSHSTASFSSAHSPVLPRSMLRSKTSCHLLEHCFFVRPGKSAETAPNSLSPCLYTASLNLLSPSFVHLRVRIVTRSMLGSKTSFHLLRHRFLARPGTRAGISTQSLSPCACTASFSLLSSTDVHLPLRLLARPMLRSKTLAICSDAVFSLPVSTQSLSPYVCTAFFSFLLSPSVH
jgi:hypothetical protein